MTMRSIYCILFILFLISCKKKEEILKNNNKKTELNDCVRAVGEYYFEYDNVSHYYTRFSPEELWEIDSNENPNEMEKLYKDLILYDAAEEVVITQNIEKIIDYGFIKSNKKIDHNALNEIFRFKIFKPSQLSETTCVPDYNHLLIFRKKNKIIGIAKICFDCNASKIFKAKVNTDFFGQCDDLSKLEILLQ